MLLDNKLMQIFDGVSLNLFTVMMSRSIIDDVVFMNPVTLRSA